MGFFSCYMGLLYNEWFAMPAWWFNSCYDVDMESSKYADYKLGNNETNGEFNFYMTTEDY